MKMILTGIENKNEYYTNHYFTSIFQENAEDTIKSREEREKNEEIQLPWKRLRDIRTQYYILRDRYLRSKNEEASKPLIQELATLYLNALGYEKVNSVTQELSEGLSVPIFHEETKANGAPLLWAFLSVADEREDDILQGRIFERSDDEEELGASIEAINDDILAKLLFAGEEAPRFILLIGINQIALIDRNKWNEKRYLQFMMEDIYSRHEETTFMAMTVLLHKESLCPTDGSIVLDSLDENSHKHSAGVSDALKYALRESIEILGNEVIYDMKTRQGINLQENPVDASELTLECLRYMYRFLFMLFIEARPELGYAPMKSQTYVQGYSLEGLRDVCDQVKEDSEALSEGYYIDDTLKKLFHMTYYGYPENLDQYKQAIEIEKNSMHDAFTIEALKAHIFDPEYTKLITKARLRNSAMLQIVDLMSISRPSSSKERKGRISYSALGINQMGAVYEALLSYRGFIAEEDLYEVKRAGDKFNELDVGYFVKENELENYDKKTERVRYESGEKKGQLRMYEKGTFIYRLAGREREKSASYYTPEVLTKCLVKYALKELLKDKTADEILHLTVCEPAMGSAAFLNEAINQLAEAYLNKKQDELGETISYDKRFEELQKVKMYIADRNVYGCDLNPVAVELAEVSLWLNTIYKGAYVPWFGTQLVNGNSLIGARRQVYSQTLLETGKWYEKAPRRVMPGEERTKKGQHEHTKEIYHFLLGDPGMANYTDKVIKSLEPENIKKLKEWNKAFTTRFNEDELKTVLRLSESIDKLWRLTAEERRKIEKATHEPLSVYGHVETSESSHKTIREKDAIYRELFKSERAQNAGPYARLKAAMDYWCALWFWPIDKVELLPSRQEFFFDMSLILEGNIKAVSVNSSGQMTFVMDNDGAGLSIITEGDQLALEFKAQYHDLGEVCLDDLRERSERLAIANQIAYEQRFQHWELEFADVFDDYGGFDLVIGNPPWNKLTWNERNVLGEYYPFIEIKDWSSSDVDKERHVWLENTSIREMYYKEYVSLTGVQTFISSCQNYEILKGVQADLYKCFIPKAFSIVSHKGVSAYVHPEGIYDDPKGEAIRAEMYKRLSYHFQFINQRKLFDIGNTRKYSLNVYSDNNGCVSFDSISNLFETITIDESYIGEDLEEVGGIKNKQNEWNTMGHSQRIIHVCEEDLALFNSVFGDGSVKSNGAKLPAIHTQGLLDILRKFARQKRKMSNISELITLSEMWHETNDTKAKVIKRVEHFPKNPTELILSGSHIGVGNALFQSSKKICNSHRAYDSVCLDLTDSGYMQRCNYIQYGDTEAYENELRSRGLWDYHKAYRLVSRKMLSNEGERTLISAVIPPNTEHINGLVGIDFRDNKLLMFSAGVFASLVGDFYIKIGQKSNVNMDCIAGLPINLDSKYAEAIILRATLLNSVNDQYKELYEDIYQSSFSMDSWAKKDSRLSDEIFSNLDATWNSSYIVRSDFARRELLLELDVLCALLIGMSIEELILMYRMQFAVLNQYEEDTWYDKNGRIVFTSNRSLSGIGLDRINWEKVKDVLEGEISYSLNCEFLSNDSALKDMVCTAPFDRCDRIKDYCEIWKTFSKRFSE